MRDRKVVLAVAGVQLLVSGRPHACARQTSAAPSSALELHILGLEAESVRCFAAVVAATDDSPRTTCMVVMTDLNEERVASANVSPAT